jgi:NhaP-type Na+/H+ or K+/H+ antiporter
VPVEVLLLVVGLIYLAAEEMHASGVVAVVVVALQLRAASDVDEAEERLVQRSFWDVVELLVTGIAFGLIGLDLRAAVEAAESGLARCSSTPRWWWRWCSQCGGCGWPWCGPWCAGRRTCRPRRAPGARPSS